MIEKITAGRDAMGVFAPKFAELNLSLIHILIVFYVSIHDLAFQAFVALRPHGDIPLRHRRKVYFRPAAAYSGVRVKLGIPKCRRLVMCAVRRRHGTAFSLSLIHIYPA